ncbi:ABC transporter substrate-binding protein [Mesorhizobium sp. M0659]|uniref:ABC transporter substrate-binding protein n=1 Tax=Mesorhizobium sp. M0659 TaxID=2956980 RepID=UPI00333CCA5A
MSVQRRDFLLGSVAVLTLGGVTTNIWAQDKRASLGIAYPIDVQSWDPTSVTSPALQSIYKTVFDSPMIVDRDGKIAPRQFLSWEWANDDMTQLKVKLREGLKFHDDTPLTTADFKYSFETRLAQNKTIVLRGMIPDLTTVDISSATDCIVNFRKPAPTVVPYFAFLGAYILPKVVIERDGLESFLAKPIGAGPYRIKDYQRGSRLLLEAMNEFWDGTPAIPSVFFQILSEPATRVAALESGEVDMALQVPIREATRLQSGSKFKVDIFPIAELYILQIPSHVDIYKDDNVRRAMHLAIDKKALSKAFYAGVAPAISVLSPPGTLGDVPDFVVPHDPAAASEALAKSGYSPEKPAKIRLLTTNGTFPGDYEVARAISAMWRAVGIEATIDEITVAKYFELNHNHKLPGVTLYSWGNATQDPENYAGRLLDPRLPFSAWKDDAVTAEVEALLREPDEAKRIAGYRALNRKASENNWCIPLLQAVMTVAYKSDIKFTPHPASYVLPAEMS